MIRAESHIRLDKLGWMAVLFAFLLLALVTPQGACGLSLSSTDSMHHAPDPAIAAADATTTTSSNNDNNNNNNNNNQLSLNQQHRDGSDLNPLGILASAFLDDKISKKNAINKIHFRPQHLQRLESVFVFRNKSDSSSDAASPARRAGVVLAQFNVVVPKTALPNAKMAAFVVVAPRLNIASTSSSVVVLPSITSDTSATIGSGSVSSATLNSLPSSPALSATLATATATATATASTPQNGGTNNPSGQAPGTASASTTTTASASATLIGGSSSGSSFGLGAIIGVIVGVLVLILLAICIFVVLARKKKQQKKTNDEEKIQGGYALHPDRIELQNLPKPSGTGGGNLAASSKSNSASNNRLNKAGASIYVEDGEELDMAIFASTKKNANAVTRDKVSMMNILAEGTFGDIYKGELLSGSQAASSESYIVIKTVRKTASKEEKQDFSEMAAMMAEFHHPNIVRTIAWLHEVEPLMLVTEFCKYKDLHQLFSQPQLIDRYHICAQVAGALTYLSSSSVAFRNVRTSACLVAENLIVKLGNFKLAHAYDESGAIMDNYTNRIFPVKWMSVEAIQSQRYTQASEIWMFGVFIWEVFSDGAEPYARLSSSEAAAAVKQLERLPAPPNCPKEVTELLSRCWEAEESRRPTFRELSNFFNANSNKWKSFAL